MLRRNDRVLPAGLHYQLLRPADELLCSVVYRGLCARLHQLLRACVHELLLGRLFELLRPDRLHDELRGRLVSGILCRSHSRTFVGLVDWLRRCVPDHLRGRLRAEYLLIVSVRLRRKLRSRERLLELFKLLDMCVAMQLVFDVHRRLRTCSGVPVRFVMRMQFV
jgi:hypothetical protein